MSEIENKKSNQSDEHGQSETPIKKKSLIEINIENNPKAGFDIGWDYWAHNLYLPSFLTEYDEVKKGYEAAKSRKVKQTEHSVYVRKWLQLRTNAWKRGRIFSAAVTPDFLKTIFNKRCPITGVTLNVTKANHLPPDGELTGSRWSVDRINNNASYYPGNLVIVSTHANLAKGNYTYEQIRDFAFNLEVELPKPINNEFRPLTRFEWARWAFICSLAPHHYHEESNTFEQSEELSPCVMFPPSGVKENSAVMLQLAISLSLTGEGSVLKNVISFMRKEVRQEIRKITDKARDVFHSYGSGETLMVWMDKKLFDMFKKTYASLGQKERDLILSKSNGRMLKRVKAAAHEESDIGLESKGFIPKQKTKKTLVSV